MIFYDYVYLYERLFKMAKNFQILKQINKRRDGFDCAQPQKIEITKQKNRAYAESIAEKKFSIVQFFFSKIN